MTILPIPHFPNVPPLPGVPQLARSPAAPVAGGGAADVDGIDADFAGLADGPALAADASREQWGIYDHDGGTLALKPDTIVGYDYRNESRVADYPVEQGAFGSYNKVAQPFDFRVTMAYASDAVGRKSFLDTLDAMLKSTALYSIHTPEGTWGPVTIDNVNYRRDARSGVQMLTVEVYAREVRQVLGNSYTQRQPGQDQTQTGATQQTQQDTDTQPFDAANTKSPDAADLKNQGRTQAAPPTPAQDAASNHAAGSANDALNAAAGGGVITLAGGLKAFKDAVNNPPAGMSTGSQADYQSTVNTLQGVR